MTGAIIPRLRIGVYVQYIRNEVSGSRSIISTGASAGFASSLGFVFPTARVGLSCRVFAQWLFH